MNALVKTKNMIIRFAEKKDVESIVNLCKLHATFEKCDFDKTNKTSLLTKYLFDDKDVLQCLVVEQHKEIIGYATFMKQFSTWDASFYLYLDCLFFLDTVRGKGLGTLLMNRIKAYAKTENCTHMQWQTPNFNTKAIQFYKKIGATTKTKERFFWNV